MPAGVPLPQAESGKGTHVHVSAGASMAVSGELASGTHPPVSTGPPASVGGAGVSTAMGASRAAAASGLVAASGSGAIDSPPQPESSTSDRARPERGRIR
jgi:hypothetical protein